MNVTLELQQQSLMQYQSMVNQAINSMCPVLPTPPMSYAFVSETPEGYVLPATARTDDDVRAREIESRLIALGSDPKAVAKSLRKQDITGLRGSPGGCAIAAWLKKNFEGYGTVSVGPHSIGLLVDGAHLTIETPPAVRDFIRLFDSGAFPELEVASYRPAPNFYEEMMKLNAPVSVKVPELVPHL